MHCCFQAWCCAMPTMLEHPGQDSFTQNLYKDGSSNWCFPAWKAVGPCSWELCLLGQSSQETFWTRISWEEILACHMFLENMSFEEDLCLKCVFKILEQLLFLHSILWLEGMAYNTNASSQTFWQKVKFFEILRGIIFLARCALHTIFVLHSKSFQLFSQIPLVASWFSSKWKGSNIGKVSS